MEKIYQTVFTIPGGNCFSACVASILELDIQDVPYFMDYDDWLSAFAKWLSALGFYPICFPHSDDWTPDGYYILSGKSPRGDYDHSVVARNGRIVHDPHPSRAGLESKIDNIILVPIEPKLGASHLRKPLLDFANRMESKLLVNDEKGGWEDNSTLYLLTRFYQEVSEFEQALGNKASAEEIANEAADCSNFLMMICDNLLNKKSI